MKKHVEKVDGHASRINTASKFFFVAAGACLAYQAVSFFKDSASNPHYSGKHHRLGAGSEPEMDMTATFSGLSCMIWGLVMQKARNGMSASGTKDTETVRGVVSNTAKLICMIIAASALQYFSTHNNPIETAIPSSHPSLKQAHPALKAASPVAAHPESFYDVNSSHYQGGAHNAALNAMVNKQAATPKVQVPNQASMGGAHNSALNAIALKANKKAASKKTRSNLAFMPTLGIFNQKNRKAIVQRPLTQAQFEDNLKRTGAFLGLLATVGMCVYFYVNLKTYHASLEKLDALTSLLNNPNARVATKEQGKEVMRKLKSAHTQQAAPVSSSPDLSQANQIQSTLDKVQELLKQVQQKEAAAEQIAAPQAGFYKPPKLVPAENNNYQLADPAANLVVSEPLLPAAQYIAQPALSIKAPVPYVIQAPQTVPQGLAINPQPAAQAESKFDSLSKADLIKLLLAQLAKETDIERQ